jgi:hypothetical protein
MLRSRGLAASRPATIRKHRTAALEYGADHDVDPRVVEVQRVGVALAPVADDGHGLRIDL